MECYDCRFVKRPAIISLCLPSPPQLILTSPSIFSFQMFADLLLKFRHRVASQ